MRYAFDESVNTALRHDPASDFHGTPHPLLFQWLAGFVTLWSLSTLLPLHSGTERASLAEGTTYTAYLGPGSSAPGASIAANPAGDAYVGAGNRLMKLNAAGTAILWQARLPVDIHAVALDGHGDVFLTGTTYSKQVQMAHPFQAHNAGQSDAFVAAFTARGRPIYRTYLGGGGKDSGRAIAVDDRGDAFVAGYTSSTDFPLARPLQRSLRGTENAFVAELAPNGRRAIFSTYLGGSGSDQVEGIAVDRAGSVTVGGDTSSSDFPTVHAYQRDYLGNTEIQNASVSTDEAFIARLAPGGGRLLFIRTTSPSSWPNFGPSPSPCALPSPPVPPAARYKRPGPLWVIQHTRREQ